MMGWIGSVIERFLLLIPVLRIEPILIQQADCDLMLIGMPLQLTAYFLPQLVPDIEAFAAVEDGGGLAEQIVIIRLGVIFFHHLGDRVIFGLGPQLNLLTLIFAHLLNSKSFLNELGKIQVVGLVRPSPLSELHQSRLELSQII